RIVSQDAKTGSFANRLCCHTGGFLFLLATSAGRSAKPVGWRVGVRTLLLTFLALFLAVALLLGVILWTKADFPWYTGLLILLALPIVLVVGVGAVVRLYPRWTSFPRAVPPSITARDRSVASSSSTPDGSLASRR